MSEQQPQPEFVRRADLVAMGFSKTDADRIMQRSGRLYRFGKAVYVRREDALRAIDEGQVRLA